MHIMVATTISTNIADIVSELLETPIEDVVAIERTTARKMYHATWQTQEGPLPIVIRFYQGTRGEEDARVESAALRSLLNAGYPVPELYLCEDNSHVAGGQQPRGARTIRGDAPLAGTHLERGRAC